MDPLPPPSQPNALEAKCQELEKLLQAEQKANAALRAKVDSLQSRLRPPSDVEPDYRQEGKELKHKVREIANQSDDLTQQLGSSKAALQTTKEKLAAANAENEALEKKYQATLRQTEQKATEFFLKLQATEMQLKQAKSTPPDDSGKQLAQLERTNNELRTANKRLSDKIKALQTTVSELEEQLAEQPVKKDTKEVDSLKKENAKLKTTEAEYKQQMADYEAELTRLSGKYRELKQKYDRLLESTNKDFDSSLEPDDS